jgi:hypothetical protein
MSLPLLFNFRGHLPLSVPTGETDRALVHLPRVPKVHLLLPRVPVLLQSLPSLPPEQASLAPLPSPTSAHRPLNHHHRRSHLDPPWHPRAGAGAALQAAAVPGPPGGRRAGRVLLSGRRDRADEKDTGASQGHAVGAHQAEEGTGSGIEEDVVRGYMGDDVCIG